MKDEQHPQDPWRSTSYLYLVRGRLKSGTTEGRLADFKNWYHQVHIPALLGLPEFLVSRKATMDNDPSEFLTIYSLTTTDVFSSAAYQRVRGWANFVEDIEYAQGLVFSGPGQIIMDIRGT